MAFSFRGVTKSIHQWPNFWLGKLAGKFDIYAIAPAYLTEETNPRTGQQQTVHPKQVNNEYIQKWVENVLMPAVKGTEEPFKSELPCWDPAHCSFGDFWNYTLKERKLFPVSKQFLAKLQEVIVATSFTKYATILYVHWAGGRELLSNELSEIEQHFTNLYETVVDPTHFKYWLIDVRCNLYAVPAPDSDHYNHNTKFKVHWNPSVIQHILQNLDEYNNEQWDDYYSEKEGIPRITVPKPTTKQVQRWCNFGTGVFQDIKGKVQCASPGPASVVLAAVPRTVRTFFAKKIFETVRGPAGGTTDGSTTIPFSC